MAPSRTELIAHIDGASRGNPGPAAYAVVLSTADEQPVASWAQFLGETTNNVAEYRGLLAALDYALQHGHPALRVLTDSELMARQIAGRYKVRNPGLKPLFDEARRRMARLDGFSILHVPREQNVEADRLANEALDAARPLSASAGSFRVSATYRGGVLRPHAPVALEEGETVELDIRRRERPPG